MRCGCALFAFVPRLDRHPNVASLAPGKRRARLCGMRLFCRHFPMTRTSDRLFRHLVPTH
jgi:hypothetical protein